MANVGPREMTSTNLAMYDVRRTSTEKLGEALNDYDEPWKITQITHVGGRDWVVVAETQWETLEAKCAAFGESLADWA